MTALLLVPRAGTGLALLLVAAGAWGYGGQVRAGGRGPAAEAVRQAPPRRLLIARVGVSLAAAAALAAPVLARNRGHPLPPAELAPHAGLLMALAFIGWLVAPLALLAAWAHDRHGPLPPRRALGAAVRHPLATLAALLVVPLGLLATEALVALVAWQQGQLPLMVADLFPPPRIAQLDEGTHFYFNYGGNTIDVNTSDSYAPLVTIYMHGLRRGFTLTALVPASLAMGLFKVRQPLLMYHVDAVHYLVVRIVLTLLILWAAGTLLTIQARWLGAIVSVDSGSVRRPEDVPRTETAPSLD
jgi:hypothetical protein